MKVVTCGVNPDLDGFASAYAYREYLASEKGAESEIRCGFEGELLLDAAFYADRLGVEWGPIPSRFDTVVLVDASQTTRAPLSVRREKRKVKVVIDHRLAHNAEIDFPEVSYVNIQEVGACSTLITEILRDKGHQPSAVAASLLHGGIHSNTLNLKAGVTKPQDLKAIELLSQWGGADESLVRPMFLFRSDLSWRQLDLTLRKDFHSSIRSPEGDVGIAQIESLNPLPMLEEYEEIIRKTLLDIKRVDRLNAVFLSAPSIDEGQNYLMPADEASRPVIHRRLGKHLQSETLDDKFIKTKRLLMRKELVPKFS